MSLSGCPIDWRVAHTSDLLVSSIVGRSENSEGAPLNAVFVEWENEGRPGSLCFPLIRKKRANEWGTLRVLLDLGFLLAR